MNEIFKDLKKNIKHGKFMPFGKVEYDGDKYEEWFISELIQCNKMF